MSIVQGHSHSMLCRSKIGLMKGQNGYNVSAQ